ncbi:MAG TPA: HEAT repeat domain-containing protein, partial [Candidatus Baltobacteraceae bacterium]
LDRAAIPALARALEEDPHPMVRGHAAWALARIGGNEAVRHLHGRMAKEQDKSVREELSAALARYRA